MLLANISSANISSANISSANITPQMRDSLVHFLKQAEPSCSRHNEFYTGCLLALNNELFDFLSLTQLNRQVITLLLQSQMTEKAQRWQKGDSYLLFLCATCEQMNTEVTSCNHGLINVLFMWDFVISNDWSCYFKSRFRADYGWGLSLPIYSHPLTWLNWV